jgi:ubiquinol-cytochrome c reductase cytochrome b subunit
MVIAVFLHMMTGFFTGSYKKPRELTWISGVVLLLIVLGLGFTGYLLPWDLKAYWATTVSTNIPKDIPLIGDFLARLMLGGDGVSGATLTRFYAVHAMLLPALLVAVLAFHIYLVRVHGISGEEDAATEASEPRGLGVSPEPSSGTQSAERSGETPKPRPYRFYPEHAWRSAIVYAVGLLALIGLSIFAHIPREPVAGTQVENYLPRPEWYYMWLFQLLTYFPGKWEAVGSLLIPLIGVTLLFVLPFLDRSPRMGARNRPLPLAVGVTAVVGIGYLTAMGFAGAKSYGQTVVVPNRALTASETRGLYLYAERDCAYCHQIDGQGGRRAGPDLSNIVNKGRTREYLARYIRDPQSITPTSSMPKYPLPDADLEALADFILALDLAKHGTRTVTRDEALAREVK